MKVLNCKVMLYLILSKLLNLCILGILHAFLSSLSGITSECQTSLDPDQMSGNCSQLNVISCH